MVFNGLVFSLLFRARMPNLYRSSYLLIDILGKNAQFIPFNYLLIDILGKNAQFIPF